MKKQWLAVLLLWALPGSAQVTGWGKDQIIKYTPLWKGERHSDGRPKVSDDLLRRLRENRTTSEEASWGPIRREGYVHQWDGGWTILNPQKRLVGRVFTVRYMPGRAEMNEIIEAEARGSGLSQSNVRTMDMAQPGDVIIADHWGDEVNGVFTGDNLAAAIFSRTGNGYVVNGGIRDWEGTEPLGFPVYFRKAHPGTFPGRMLVGINVPVQIGDVTVMPGDVVVGDEEGLSFIPPHLVDKVVAEQETISLVDEWRKEKFLASKGSIKPSDLYGAVALTKPVYQKECREYVSKKLAERGLKISAGNYWQGRRTPCDAATIRTNHPGELPPQLNLTPMQPLETSKPATTRTNGKQR